MPFDTSISLPPDASTEAAWRNFARVLGAKFGAMGLTQTADTGQLNLDQADVSALTVNTGFPVANAFDTNAAAVYQSTAAPSIGTPQWVRYDAGAGQTFTPASWAIYTSNLAADPRDVILQHSANGTAWTDFDTRALTASTGYQSFNLTAPPARRYWRVAVTSTQAASAFLQVSEFQLWTGPGMTLLRATPITIRPTAVNTTAGFMMFALADALQATAPGFLKVEFGTGATTNVPSIWLSIGNATDGAGNFTGISSPARQQLACNTNLTAPQKCYFAGGTNWLACSLFYNSAAHISFGVERSYNPATGDDTGDYLVYAGRSATLGFSALAIPGMAPPPVQANMGCNIAAELTTSAFGDRLSPEYFEPRMGVRLPPMRRMVGYFNVDATQEVPKTMQILGQNVNRTYFPIGNNVAGISNNANIRLAIEQA